MTARNFALVAVLLCLVLPGPGQASAAGRTPLVAGTLSHGVRITLTIPNRVYPRDALARFTVSLTNVSRARRYLQDFPPDWGGPFSPHILMRTRSGRMVYEEDLSTFLAPTPGTLGRNFVLQPGRTLTRHVRFVLAAGDVRAVSRVADGYTAYTDGGPPVSPPRIAWAHHLWGIATPWIHLTLRTERAPTATVSRESNRIRVTVHAPWRTTGPMFYMDSARCWTGPGTMSTEQHISWTRAPGASFTSALQRSCPSRQPWHAVVGWPDHRVLFLSYADAARIRSRVFSADRRRAPFVVTAMKLPSALSRSMSPRTQWVTCPQDVTCGGHPPAGMRKTHTALRRGTQ